MTQTVETTPNGVAAVTSQNKTLSYAEKMSAHKRLVRFLESADSVGMSDEEVAKAIGVTAGTVRRNRQAMAPRPAPAPSAPLGPRSKLPHGEPWRRVEKFGRENPGEHTIAGIAKQTGLSDGTVRNVLAQHGLELEYPGDAPANAAGVVSFGDTPSPAPQENAGEESSSSRVRFIGYASDGTPIARVEGTELLWRLKLDRPL